MSKPPGDIKVRIEPPAHWWGAHYLTLHIGPTVCSKGWFVWGCERAKKKARRLIEREKLRNKGGYEIRGERGPEIHVHTTEPDQVQVRRIMAAIDREVARGGSIPRHLI